MYNKYLKALNEFRVTVTATAAELPSVGGDKCCTLSRVEYQFGKIALKTYRVVRREREFSQLYEIWQTMLIIGMKCSDDHCRRDGLQ